MRICRCALGATQRAKQHVPDFRTDHTGMARVAASGHHTGSGCLPDEPVSWCAAATTGECP